MGDVGPIASYDPNYSTRTNSDVDPSDRSDSFYKKFLNKIYDTNILFMIVVDDGFNHDRLQRQAANKWWTICSNGFIRNNLKT